MLHLNEFYERIWRIGVIPVVVLERVADAAPLAEALVRGGLPAAEVTFRTPAAGQAMREMRLACPGMLIGSGTVLSCEDVDRTVEAGGQFAVSPGFDEAIVKHCLELDLPPLPAAVTPTELMAVRRLGLTVSKFFPASVYGDLAAIRALAAPFVGHRFMPTGGVSQDNLESFFSDPSIIACGGTWMVKEKLISEGRFDEIEALARKAADTVRALRGA